MFDADAVHSWLRILHGDAPGFINVCCTGDWSGASFPTDRLDAAVAQVVGYEQRTPEGIYVRVTTLREPPSPGKRGGVTDTMAVPALWADVDIAGPGHAEGDLPPDEVTARAVIASSGLPEPTLWVNSGGGLYPIWLLDTPHTVDDDLIDLSDLSTHWQQVIGAAAKALGYRYGTGVGDLARVLRIPGTVNRKAGLQRPCRIIEASGTRYPLAALYGAAADAVGSEEEHPVASGGIRSHPLSSLSAPAHPVATGEVSPGDDFAARRAWEDILEPHGWRLAYRRGEVGYWVRPGKRTPGISATTNALGTDRLRVFSTDAAPFEATGYSKLAAFAALEHRGDLSAAARALYSAGYGTRHQAPDADPTAGLVAPRDVPTSPDPPPADVEPLDAELLAEVRYAEDVAYEARKVRIRRDAHKRVEAEDFERDWREPVSTLSLREELDIPDEPVTYLIDRLLPSEGNAVLTAAFKAGKTTLCNNLVRCLADGEPFLGRFDVAPPEGRIAIFNYEVGPSQYRRWLRDIGISDLDRVCVLNVRGHRLPPTVPHIEAWIAKWLTDRQVSVWVVDPFAAAFTGSGDENSNGDVGAFLTSLDVIKARAGVAELILPVHTGRAEHAVGQERARGATRLDDWADARWLLTVDDQGRRFFRASGRDVEVEEELLTHDPVSNRLTIGGWDRRGMANQDVVAEVIAYVAEHPGIGVNEICEGVPRSRNRVTDALRSAVGGRRLVAVETTNAKRLHYLAGHDVGGVSS